MNATKATMRENKKRRRKIERVLRITAAILLIPVFLVWEFIEYGIKHPKRFCAICFVGAIVITSCYHAFSHRFPVRNVNGSEHSDYVEVTPEVIFSNNFVDIGPSTSIQDMETIAVGVTETAIKAVNEPDYSIEVVDEHKADERIKLEQEKYQREQERENVRAIAEKERLILSAKEMAKSLGLPNDYDAVLSMVGMCLLVDEEGFTPEGAAGLMGNIYCESRFFVGADNGSHFGIMQWDYQYRWPMISEYLEKNQCELYSRHDNYSGYKTMDTNLGRIEIFKAQLRAALHSEDAKNYPKTIDACKNATSASYSADLWRKNYEVCGGAIEERKQAAENALELYYSLLQ